jgi:plastocyanin
MALSSVTVVLNALRLRSFDAGPTASHRVGRAGPLGRLRDAWFLIVVLLAAFVVVGGVMAADRWVESRATHVTVTARDIAYHPADLRVEAGRTVVLSFRNDDPVFHDWMVDGVANVDAGARPGQTQTIRFTIDAPGTYRITCTVPGHADAGMTGTLVVDSAD